MLPLELLDAGDYAEVTEVAGSPDWICRLAELGLRAGSRLKVLQAGRPCLLQVGGALLSIRGEFAAQILVSPVAPG